MSFRGTAQGATLTEQMGHAVSAMFEVLAKVPKEAPLAIGLCGGRSVVGLLRELARASVNQPRELMQRLQFFMVDERIVPLTDPDSNFGGLKAQLFDELIEQGLISENQLHPFAASLDDAPENCQEYYQELQRFGGRFAVVVLGVGEDGHVAGLFPRHPVLEQASQGFASFFDSPKPPPARMTATRALIQSSSLGILLALGEGKRQAWDDFCAPLGSVRECPARMVKEMGEYLIVTDLNG
jgi:6-phosphogluconolactonase